MKSWREARGPARSGVSPLCGHPENLQKALRIAEEQSLFSLQELAKAFGLEPEQILAVRTCAYCHKAAASRKEGSP